jgi:hypothetical protein
MRARIPRRLDAVALHEPVVVSDELAIERRPSFAGLTEKHEVVVPCDASPTGTHRARLWRAGDEIIYLATECDGREGDALVRLGGKSCRSVVLDVRRTVLSSGVSHDDAGNYVRRPEVPSGIADVVSQSAVNGVVKRRSRAPAEVDQRYVFVRLLEKWARKFAGFGGFHVVIDGDGTRKLVKPGGYRREYIIAHKHRGSAWHVDSDELAKAAKYTGFVERGMRGERCLVCPDQAERNFNDVKIHARAPEHRRNVVQRFRAAVARLP